MDNTKKILIRIILFIIIVTLILSTINSVLLPKYYYTIDWPTTSAYKEFYKMDKESIDVIFLGSSHGETSFYPQEIYDRFGIRSYNLCCEQQSIITSYYWLKETLRYQTPKVVILESTFCFPFYPWCEYNQYNSTAEYTRKAIEAMKWSKNKIEAIKDFEKYDKEFALESFVFTNLKYNSRWEELNEEDFSRKEIESYTGPMGFTLIKTRSNNYEYRPICKGDSSELTTMMDLMKKYFIKIVELCQENGIAFVLATTPAITQKAEIHNTCVEMSLQYGFNYYDFNYEDLYNEIDYVFSVDNSDNAHAGFTGAIKISSKIGEILVKEYQVDSVEDKQWEDSREFNNRLVNNLNISMSKDSIEYFELISKYDYDVFAAVKGDFAKNSLNVELKKALSDGFGININSNENIYLGANIQGEVKATSGSYTQLSIRGLMREKKSNYNLQVETLGDLTTNAYINIDNCDYSQNKEGINLVVYDPALMKVIDSAYIDLSNEMIVNR